MEQLYCTIFIVDVSQNPEEVETISSRIVQLIEDHGGLIKRNERWGKRRLAYPIRNRTSGFYVEIEFTANSRLNIPKIIENEYRLNDRVMRYLTYAVTKDELLQRELSATRTQYQDEDSNGDEEIVKKRKFIVNEKDEEDKVTPKKPSAPAVTGKDVEQAKTIVEENVEEAEAVIEETSSDENVASEEETKNNETEAR